MQTSPHLEVELEKAAKALEDSTVEVSVVALREQLLQTAGGNINMKVTGVHVRSSYRYMRQLEELQDAGTK